MRRSSQPRLAAAAEVEEPLALDETRRPLHFNKARRVNDRLSLPGVGNANAKVMIIAISPQEEELKQAETLHSGVSFKFPARLLKGPSGALMKELCSRSGFNIEDCWYTTLVKWFPEKGRTRPTKEEIAFWSRALEEEIKQVQPDVIVCMGKPVFDALYHRKLAYNDIGGGWFWSEKYKTRLYPTDEVGALVHRPELYGRFVVDLHEIGRMFKQLNGVHVPELARHYHTIYNSSQLQALVDFWRAHNFQLFSVDCEWEGNQHIDGKLRSIQFCWMDGHAAYVRFRDEHGNYVFDVSYEEAGQILGQWLNLPHVKYVGHHIAADFPWMQHWLKLDVDAKALLDTEFALQCCDEYADLGLDRIGMAYTDLGRYDVDLMLWLKDNPQPDGAGYGFIPDSILIEYACRDVDVVFRAAPKVLAFMEREGVTDYYFNVFHPFVTDVFTDYAINGLPMDIQRMDDLRYVLHTARRLMEEQIASDIFEEARGFLWALLLERAPQKAQELFQLIETKFRGEQDSSGAFELFVEAVGVDNLRTDRVIFDHYILSRSFSIRSVDDMRRWLFDVKKFTPIKSTNRKEQGMPSIPWEKVMELPPDKRALFKPSTDKQTLEILGETYNDDLLRSLLLLNAVGNLCKAFLKEPERDEEGNIDKECGLHYFLASDGRIHGQLSTTETGRPRAWKPNSLNFPGYTHARVAKGVKQAISRALREGKIAKDDPIVAWLEKDIPSIRSCVKAYYGWMMVESDFKTAELRGLAFISGDEAFIKMMTEPDTRFGLVKHNGKLTQVRLEWRDDDPYVTGVSDDWLLAVVEKQKVVQTYTRQDLIKDESGNIVHPDLDLHWDLAERVHKTPRELLAKKDRNSAKVGNFCIAEGEKVLTKRGPINIENIRGCDLLWDGVEWVSHDGVVYSGKKEVIYYQGLWATEQHEVWTDEKGKVHLAEACAQRLSLTRTGSHSPCADDNSCPGVQKYPRRVAKTYDILNAGPRNRFTCSGVLVSNSSAYGASAGTLERKIEQDTGEKPEPGTGEKILSALETSRPVAFSFLKSLERAPYNPGYLVAASGRKRRFSLHPSHVAGISDRMRKGRASAQGREARNFFMQTSVADTAARAGVWLRRRYRQLGLKAHVMIILYDSVVTLCPPEEREIVSRLHQIYMCDMNVWKYHDRIMNYPIDTDFVVRWSDPGNETEEEAVWKHVAAIPAEQVLAPYELKPAA